MNEKGSNPLDRWLAWLALEAIPRAAPVGQTFFKERVDVGASNRVCRLINLAIVASIYRNASGRAARNRVEKPGNS